MLLLTDWVQELLSLQGTPFRVSAVSALLLTLVALLFRTLLWLWSSWHCYYVNCQRLRCFPEPPRRNWLLGHLGMAQNTEEGLQRVDELVGHYSHSCLWWFGPWCPILRLFHPEAIKPVLLESADVAPKDYMFYGFLKPWLGPTWPRCHYSSLHRTPVSDAVPSALPGHALPDAVLPQTKWYRLAALGFASLEMFEQVSLMTLDSLQKCVFSYNSNCQETSSDYIAAILELSSLVVRRQHRLLLHCDLLYHLVPDGWRFRRACDTVHRFTAAVVQQRRQALSHLGREAWLKSKQGKTVDFIDVLLLAKAMTPQPVASPGYCITWRVTPVTRSAAERRSRTYCSTRSWRRLNGNICLISIYGTHHNPAVWPEPQVYNPLRFDPENSQNRPPLAFMPFSAGPRNCIGQNFAMAEMKVVLALTLLRFAVRLDESRPVQRKPELILRSENGLWLHLEPLGPAMRASPPHHAPKAHAAPSS